MGDLIVLGRIYLVNKSVDSLPNSLIIIFSASSLIPHIIDEIIREAKAAVRNHSLLFNN
jgi:hypothetical protein